MGYIIIDREKLRENLKMWNNSTFARDVTSEIYKAEVDATHLLKALKEAENKIDSEIKKLQNKKSDISLLMDYAG